LVLPIRYCLPHQLMWASWRSPF